VPFSKAVKQEVGDKLLVTAVGTITNGPQAEEIAQSGVDGVFVGRYFQKNPGLGKCSPFLPPSSPIVINPAC
jgi:tRNA-dihydrouridine synthase